MTAPAGLYLGVDGGNTKTAALLCTADGTIVGAGRGGCGDIYGAGSPATAAAEVDAAVAAALTAAGAGIGAVVSAAFRLAGVDWPEDRAYWDAELAARYPTLRRRTVLNDGYAAIRCGEPSGVGVAVQAGTAGAVAARGPDGALWDLGFWAQHHLGAGGLAHEARRAVYLAELGLGPQTALTGALTEFYGKRGATELNHWFSRREGGAPPPAGPRAARTVVATAAAGDPVAAALVRDQGRHLAAYAGVAARKTGLAGPDAAGGKVSVVLSGSMLMAEASPVTAALLEELDVQLPGAAPHVATLPPVTGAVLDALGEGGVALTPDVTARIGTTAPPADFLAT